MIDLAPEHLATVCRLLAAHVPECEARAFGSRVAWTAKSYSDLDLALVGTEKLAPSRLRRLREAFEESNLPIRIDLLDWYAISESFQKVISEQFEVIQQAAKVSVGRTEWEILHLGDLGRVVTGKTPLTAVEGNFGGQIPFVTPSDMDGRKTISTTARNLTETGAASVKGSKIPAGSVMVSCIGSDMGKAVIAGCGCVTNQQINSIVVDGRFSSEFVYYNLSTRKDEIRHQAAGGSAQPILNKGDFSRLEISLPPLAEQKAIAAVLGALDDKIELNRRMNATLEAMARALFQSWFVDFDPVRAKLDGRLPVGLDPATAALFPEHFEHGEHEMLPVGWRHAAIEEFCAINAWTLGKNDDLEMLEYVEISEVSLGNIGNMTTYQRGEEPSRARRRLRHGDTVLSTVRPDRGSYFLALNPPENRVASTGFAVLTPTKAPWSFVHAAMTLPEVSDHLGQMADGGAYPAVRPEIIGVMKVALPDEPKILEAFHRTCAPLFEQAEANRTQSHTLATLRDTLLPKLLSGELRHPIKQY